MESAAEDDDDSVGFDFQILHQSAATGESLALSLSKGQRATPLSQTEGDEYHLKATASRGNMIAWRSWS
jgi:hypothetical protein